jgi:hypothetical protein
MWVTIDVGIPEQRGKGVKTHILTLTHIHMCNTHIHVSGWPSDLCNLTCVNLSFPRWCSAVTRVRSAIRNWASREFLQEHLGGPKPLFLTGEAPPSTSGAFAYQMDPPAFGP